ncbi:MAG: hypothetical protein FJ316_09890 [SAR202 cluster bacterium]|nr:hypothetical protein [SAR202 cluster bacterium]
MNRDMDLDEWYRLQNGAVRHNRAEIESEYVWLDKAIKLLSDIHIFVNDRNSPVALIRSNEKQEYPELHQARNVVVNLANDALGSLVTGTRLLLFGAHADAFALVRSAFEGCCNAEYFALHTEDAQHWLDLEKQLSGNLSLNVNSYLRNRKLSRLQITSILKVLEKCDGENRSEFYAKLCNLGAHASPVRVFLRLSPPKGAVLAAVSVSTPDWSRAKWTQGCAWDLMAVAKYAVTLLPERFPEWFVSEQDLIRRVKQLEQEFLKLTV